MPLSTLHPAPHGTQRQTRGQDGSLLLSCGALSSPTARRFIPTLTLANARGSVTLSNQGSCYRAMTVREWLRTLSALSLSLSLSLMKMAHWLARPNFHGICAHSRSRRRRSLQFPAFDVPLNSDRMHGRNRSKSL